MIYEYGIYKKQPHTQKEKASSPVGNIWLNFDISLGNNRNPVTAQPENQLFY